MERILDFTDIEILADGSEQAAPLVIKDREVAMRFGRVVAETNAMLDRGAITRTQAEQLWSRALYQARQEDGQTGIIVARG